MFVIWKSGRCLNGRTLNLYPVLDYPESRAIMLFPSFPGTKEFEITGTPIPSPSPRTIPSPGNDYDDSIYDETAP